MGQGVLSDDLHLAGALTLEEGLKGELSSHDVLAGKLTLPTEVNGRNYKTFLMHDWDFTAGLTDRVQGSKATLGGDAVKLEDGVHFKTHKDFMTLDITYEYNRTYVIDFGEMRRRANTDQHGRVFMPMPDMGVMFRMTEEWLIWGQDSAGKKQWCSPTGLKDPDVFANRSMKIFVDINGAISVYLDQEPFFSTDLAIPKSGSISIGSGAWQSFFLMTIRGFREYYGFFEG